MQLYVLNDEERVGYLNLVSIIMPCYNDGAYLLDAISSLQTQTYTNIELILIDDGSTCPESIAALSAASLIEQHKILYTNHLGPSQARNYGIQHARGVYILPLDADDKIAPSYIERAVELLDADPQIGAVYCQAELFGDKNGRWDLPAYSLDSMLLDNIVFVSGVYRKSDWEAIGGYRTTYEHGMEDYDFWLSILELERTIHQIPEVLFFYRIKPTSRTTQFMDSIGHVQETYRLLYANHPTLYNKYRDEYATLLRKALIEQSYDRRYLSAELEKLKARYAFFQLIRERIPYPIKKVAVKIFRLLSRLLAKKKETIEK